MADTISSEQLKTWLDAGKKFLLIDVLPPEYFDEKHIPRAHNACVYETSFIELVGSLASDKETPIVVYGSSARSAASSAAADKLLQFGYTQVIEFKGGTEEWQSRRYPVEGEDGAIEAFPAEAVRTVVAADLIKSRVLWIDRNYDDQHFGTMKLADGCFELGNDLLISARFWIDMSSLACNDIVNENLNGLLVDQLKSKGFFDVEAHPTAELTLTRIVGLESPSSDENCNIFANLTLKGVTNELEFPAKAGLLENGAWVLQAYFDIDREKWPNLYGPENVVFAVGRQLATDYITMQLSVYSIAA